MTLASFTKPRTAKDAQQKTVVHLTVQNWFRISNFVLCLVCIDCLGFGNCWAVEKTPEVSSDGYTTNGYPEVSISSHGFVSGEEAMMKVIKYIIIRFLVT